MGKSHQTSGSGQLALARAQAHQRGRGQFPCPGEDGQGGRDVVETQKEGQCPPVDLPVETGVGEKRAQLRAEEDDAARHRVVQRLLAQAVPGEVQDAVPAVPQGQGEHGIEPLESRAQAPGGHRLHHHLGVAMAPEAPAPVGQGGPQLGGVVTLSVVGGDPAAIGRDHGLVAGRREVDDGQSAVTEAHPGLAVAPGALVVGPPMGQGPGHGASEFGKLLGRPRPARVQQSGDAAHCLLPSIRAARRRSRSADAGCRR